jgi:hypothetical protein
MSKTARCLAILLSLVAVYPLTAQAIPPPGGTVTIAKVSSRELPIGGSQTGRLSIDRYRDGRYAVVARGTVDLDFSRPFNGCRVYLQVRVDGRLIANTFKPCGPQTIATAATAPAYAELSPARGRTVTVEARARLDVLWGGGVVRNGEMHITRRLSGFKAWGVG